MLKDTRAFVAVWVVALVAVLVLRAVSFLQPFELRTYYFLLSQMERPSSVPDRIALAEISEADIQELGQVAHDFEREPCRILPSERTYSLQGEQGSAGQCDVVGEVALKGKVAQVSVYALRTARN